MIEFVKTPPADWCAKYIGLPYREKGRDIRGLDCLGLNLMAYRDDFGQPIAGYEDEFAKAQSFTRTAMRLVRAHKQVWTPVTMPLCGVSVLMEQRDQPVHVGLSVGQGWLIHADCGLGQVVRERITSLEHAIIGYFVPPNTKIDPRIRVLS